MVLGARGGARSFAPLRPPVRVALGALRRPACAPAYARTAPGKMPLGRWQGAMRQRHGLTHGTSLDEVPPPPPPPPHRPTRTYDRTVDASVAGHGVARPSLGGFGDKCRSWALGALFGGAIVGVLGTGWRIGGPVHLAARLRASAGAAVVGGPGSRGGGAWRLAAGQGAAGSGVPWCASGDDAQGASKPPACAPDALGIRDGVVAHRRKRSGQVKAPDAPVAWSDARCANR